MDEKQAKAKVEEKDATLVAELDVDKWYQLVSGDDNQTFGVILLTPQDIRDAERLVSIAEKNRKMMSMEQALKYGFQWGVQEQTRREQRLVDMHKRDKLAGIVEKLTAMLTGKLINAEQFAESVQKAQKQLGIGGTEVELS